jgi:hypothetical protein
MVGLSVLWDKIQSLFDGVIFTWSWKFGGTGMSSPWTYFKPEEVEGLDNEFIAKLEKARHIAGVPFEITSGKRTEGANATAGGVQDSAHLSGRAVDLRSRTSHTHFKIVEGAIVAGIRRIGVYRNQEGSPSHIHLDDASDLPQEVLWLGVSH